MNKMYYYIDHIGLINNLPEVSEGNKVLYDKLNKFYNSIKYRNRRKNSIISIFKDV